MFDDSGKKKSRLNASAEKLMESVMVSGSGEIRKNDVKLAQPIFAAALSSSSNNHSVSLRNGRSNLKE